MGSSFYLGWLIPRETSLVIWGSEGEGSRFKASKVKNRLPFTDYCQYDSQKEEESYWKAPVCETRQKELERVAVVSTSQFNDYL
jgi:hypothetical protein